MIRRHTLFVPLLLLIAGLSPIDASGQHLLVARVIDGDTFELSDGQRVRLIGIDTPEKHASAKLNRDAVQSGTSRRTIQALGQVASDYARMLVQDRRVELEYDQANAAIGHRDRYGRTLAYVWLLGSNGQRSFMVNRRLVADGYANAYTSYPFALAEEFRQLERLARERQEGLWADDVVNRSAAAQRPSEAVETSLVGSASRKVLHRTSCTHARRIQPHNKIVFQNRREAQSRGYRPCKVCKP